jgi:hypothetical protein
MVKIQTVKKNKAAQALGRLSYKKSPRSTEFYSEIGKKGSDIRWGKKGIKGIIDN